MVYMTIPFLIIRIWTLVRAPIARMPTPWASSSSNRCFNRRQVMARLLSFLLKFIVPSRLTCPSSQTYCTKRCSLFPMGRSWSMMIRTGLSGASGIRPSCFNLSTMVATTVYAGWDISRVTKMGRGWNQAYGFIFLL